jgi:hypothetical protein
MDCIPLSLQHAYIKSLANKKKTMMSCIRRMVFKGTNLVLRIVSLPKKFHAKCLVNNVVQVSDSSRKSEMELTSVAVSVHNLPSHRN